MDSRKEQGPAGKFGGQQQDLLYYIKLLYEKGRKNSPYRHPAPCQQGRERL